MNRKHDPRSIAGRAGAPRIRAMHATGAPIPVDDSRTGSGSADSAGFMLLSELLVGESTWTMAEVGRLVTMRDLADLGRWRVAGLDDEGLTGT